MTTPAACDVRPGDDDTVTVAGLCASARRGPCWEQASRPGPGHAGPGELAPGRALSSRAEQRGRRTVAGFLSTAREWPPFGLKDFRCPVSFLYVESCLIHLFITKWTGGGSHSREPRSARRRHAGSKHVDGAPWKAGGARSPPRVRPVACRSLAGASRADACGSGWMRVVDHEGYFSGEVFHARDRACPEARRAESGIPSTGFLKNSRQFSYIVDNWKLPPAPGTGERDGVGRRRPPRASSLGDTEAWEAGVPGPAPAWPSPSCPPSSPAVGTHWSQPAGLMVEPWAGAGGREATPAPVPRGGLASDGPAAPGRGPQPCLCTVSRGSARQGHDDMSSP